MTEKFNNIVHIKLDGQRLLTLVIHHFPQDRIDELTDDLRTVADKYRTPEHYARINQQRAAIYQDSATIADDVFEVEHQAMLLRERKADD